MSAPKLLSVREVAAYCGVSVSTVRNWVKGFYFEGGAKAYKTMRPLPSIRLGQAIRIKQADLDRWIEAR
jgi:transposase|nr:MAG TPA: helix-turn-helix domain protein [Caudoviricetes sp.]